MKAVWILSAVLVVLAWNIEEVQGQNANCNFRGKAVGNGKSWLINNCRRKLTCKNGNVKPKSHSCPSQSICRNNKCQCKNGYSVKSRGSGGMLKSCKRNSRNCRFGNRNFQNGKSWLSNNCRKKHKCRNGNIVPRVYNCPNNAVCVNNQCRCKNGYSVKSRGSGGMLKSCKRNARNCRFGNKTYQNGKSWLSNNCRKKRICRDGNAVLRSYNCPANSNCQNNQCRCKSGFSVKSRDSSGLLKSCIRGQGSNNCRFGGKTYQNGKSWLTNSCRKKQKCKNGDVVRRAYNCPSNAVCVNNQCRCKNGFRVKSRGSNGFVKACERGQGSGRCRFGGKNYQNGKSWLSHNCRKKQKCRNGNIQPRQYSCPSNSNCVNNQCRCKNGFRVKSRGSNGLVKSCERKVNCQFGGKNYQNGKSWLSNNCRKKQKCKNGNVVPRAYNCPNNAVCVNNQCKCKNGFRVKSRGSNGFVKACERGQGSGKCSVGGKNYRNGKSWLTNNCRKKKKCRNGNVQEKNYNCPGNSNCRNNQCKCKNGFRVKSRGSNGRVKSCERKQNSQTCRFGNKNYQNGKSWLSNNCRKKHKCRNGNVVLKAYNCPNNAVCVNNQCRCKNGFRIKSRDSGGLIKACKRNQGSQRCKWGLRFYGNGKSWLTNNCSRKRKCVNGNIVVKINRCPNFSRCNKNKCVCRNGYKVKSRGSNGRLTACERGQGPKKCRWGIKFFGNGRSWLTNSCRKSRKCVDGKIVVTNNRCPNFSRCNKNVCVCRNGYKVKSRGSNGRLTACEKKRNDKCRRGNRVISNGRAWLSNGCRWRFRCKNGNIKGPQRYNCPSNSICRNGQCHCKAKFRVKSKTSGGLLKSCGVARNCGQYKHGSRWLNGQCTKKFRCMNSQIKSRTFKCPANSQCKLGGQCACNFGYTVKSKDKDGILTRCKESEKLRCKTGFRRIFGKCLSVHKDANVKYVEAHRRCKAKGGRLLIVKNIFNLGQKIWKNKKYREGVFFVMGSRDLSAKELKNYKSKAIRLFILSMIKRHRCQPDKRFRIFKRFSGAAVPADWNYVSPLRAYCLAVSRRGPVLVRCSQRRGFICEQGNKDENDEKEVFWTKWYNTGPPNDVKEKESLGQVLKKYNKDYTGERVDRLCRRPIAMQCREVNTNKLYSKNQQHNLKLNRACTNNMILCIKKRQQGGNCPDMEIRFKCLEDDANDCGIDMVRRGCRNQGKRCVNRRTGAVCVRQRRVRNKKDRADILPCQKEDKTYEMHMCKATGDPHYTTFDGRHYNFMGTCSYEFAVTCNNYQSTDKFPSFKIVSKNYKKKPGVPSWTKSFEFTLGGFTYRFDQGTFSVNSITIEDVCDFEDVNIKKIDCKAKGNSVTLTIWTFYCLKISWDNMHGLYVYVPTEYKNHICGLCGNFDGNPGNDLRKPGSNTDMTSSELGRYYLEPGLNTENDVCPRVITDPVPCSADKKLRLSQPDKCGVFNVNGASPIVKKVLEDSDPAVIAENKKFLEKEFNDCVQDMCWDTTTDRCEAIEDVIDKLDKALHFYDDDLDNLWRNFASCQGSGERRCSRKPNMVYKSQYKPACQNTCASPEQAFDCEDENKESGCVCKEGFFLDAKRDCVTSEECAMSCQVDLESSSFTLRDKKEYVKTPCEMILYCDKGVLKEKKMEPCHLHAECRRGRKCRCNDGYIGNGHECKTDLSCRRGYTAIGEKCYKFVPKGLDWHSAAINCGVDGSVLARYDDLVGEELVTFIKQIPQFYLKSKAQRRRIFCRRVTILPRHFQGLDIKLRSPRDKAKCQGKFFLSKNKRFIKVTGGCRAWFNVRMIKTSRGKMPFNKKMWTSGNSHVVSQKQRGDKTPFQIDPPRMLDLSVFNDQDGCFQANLNRAGKLIVTPNPRCYHKKPSICEYDNVGKIPYDPLNFRRLKNKASYEEAVEMCKKLGRPLASILGKMQSDKIKRMLRHLDGDAWIGAKYSKNKDKFVWSDNKPVSYTNWRGNSEPNNYNNNDQSDEQCVAVDKSNGWFTDNCDELNYPICGPPFNMESASYSKYYRVRGFSSVGGLRKKLARQGKPDYVCERPISIECSAREPGDGQWRNNHNQQGNAMKCKAGNIKCRPGRGLDCSTFRARFLCPSEENQCAVLKSENINPCSGGRSCLPLRNHYRCRCTNGAMWNKQTQSCHKSCGMCTASGDPHYTTFNGKPFDFMGTCMYKFAGVCELDQFRNSPHFDIYTKNEPCGNRGASCLQYIEVHLKKMPYKHAGVNAIGNFVFKVSVGTTNYMFKINQEADQTRGREHFVMEGAFKVDRRPNYFNLRSDALALNVLFSGRRLTVNLPSRFRGHMCGACGDCGTDQFRKKDLSLVSVPFNGKKYDRQAIIPVINEWIVPYDGSDPELCKSVEPIDDTCNPQLSDDLKKDNMCGIFKNELGPLKSCFENIATDTMYDDCLVDACHEDPMKSICQAVMVYAQNCMAIYDKILTWRSDDFCPMDCGEKVYHADASCEPTCGVDPAASCEEAPEEGCVCPNGLMRQGEECVKPEKCGCEVTIGDDNTAVFIPLHGSKLLPRCEEIAKCESRENGASEVIREPVDLDVHAVCVEDPDPRIDCASGYIFAQDGKSCIRDPEACSQGFIDREGICVKIPDVKLIWRQAVQACNKEDGTLVLVNSNAKLEELGKIMKENNFESVFITGHVTAKVVGEDVSFVPVVSSDNSGKIEYYNFDYHQPPVGAISLSTDLKVEDLRSNDVILALVAILGDADTVSIVAVPKDTQTNFVCEQRDVKPADEEWHGPCNSDKDMSNGDIETKEALEMLVDCHICPVPMEVRCTPVPGAVNSGQGECKMTQSEVYYSCNTDDCQDNEVSTKCARDLDECATGFDDCPTGSTCQNTIGAYLCKCNADTPLMVKGYCHEKLDCALKRPSDTDSFDVNVLSGSSGTFSYNCPFIMFETCQNKYDVRSGLPYLRLIEDPSITSRVLVGVIRNPANNVEKYFVLRQEFSENGFLIGDSLPDARLQNFGSFQSIETRFDFIRPSTILVRHFDNAFAFSFDFEQQTQIHLMADYANIGCGLCTMSPSNEKFTLTPEQVLELSGPLLPDISECGEEDEVLTTEPAGPTTTPEPFPNECDEDTKMFCNSLKDLCSYDENNCKDRLCGTPQNFCSYLEMIQVSTNCNVNDRMDNFLRDLNCDSFCTGSDMSFAYTGGNPPARCQEETYVDESAAVNSFACQCDVGYRFSGDKCVPKAECGCKYMDNYLVKNDVFVNNDCTKMSRCLGDNVMEVSDMECSEHATCVNSSSGTACKCDDGYYGEAAEKDGCKPPVKEDETKKCYITTNPEGMLTEKCECKAGYVSQCKNCVDLDECVENEHQCDLSKEKCVNKIGSYECNCKEGFEAVAGECKDIDECQRNTARCGMHQGCANTVGSYECKCCAGFTANAGNTGCVKDPTGVEIRISQPKCCLQCDDPDKCTAQVPEPQCFIEGGKGKEFPSYKDAFEFVCVNNEPKTKLQAGNCPKDIPTTTTEKPVTEGSGSNAGSTPSGGEGEGSEGSNPNPSQPSDKTTTPKVTTAPPPPSCNSPNFCDLIPEPPRNLQNGPVCGPKNKPVPQTFPNYCAMAKSVCLDVGSFSNMPPTSISADSGPCPTTTPPPPPTTTKPPVPTQIQGSQPAEPTEAAVTSAPIETTPRETAQTAAPLEEPLFGEYSPWGKCQPLNTAVPCGLGRQSRSRQVIPYGDDREVRPVMQSELVDERDCFSPCDPDDENFQPEWCSEEGVCGEQDSPICGSMGNEGYQTYPNECEFNIQACKARMKPNVLFDGECGEGGEPRHLCSSGPRTVKKKLNEVFAGGFCIGEEKEIFVCNALSCKGGSENCCIPTEYDTVEAAVKCYSDEGIEMREGKIVYVTVKGCKCSEDSDEEVGSQPIK